MAAQQPEPAMPPTPVTAPAKTAMTPGEVTVEPAEERKELAAHDADDSDSPAQITRALLSDLLGPPSSRDFAIRLWDGSPDEDERPPGTPLRFTLVIRRPGALRRMFLPPSELAIGEAYLRDDFDVEGDLEAVTALSGTVAARLGAHLGSPRALLDLIQRLRKLPTNDLARETSLDAVSGETGSTGATGKRGTARMRPALARLGLRHSRARDAAAVRYHYDVGNDFYALWLDRRMVYSCAYFPTGTEDLDTAQEAKLDHICRKLRLRPGERLLDIGCGWGGLVQFAAERYGVEALGVTLSEPQAAIARERITQAGLADRCRIEVRDYRALLDADEGSFDKIVSVGMFEHVGRAKLPTYFATAYQLLRPGGLFLNHGIATGPANSAHGAGADGAPGARGMNSPLRLLWRPGAFVWKYVFPDGELIPPADALQFAEAAGFETWDVENLREHYTLTLRHWVRRLEAQHEEAVQLVGEPTYRVWRLYMAASAHSFASGQNALIQALLSKPHTDGRAELPLTRADIYAAIPQER